MRKRKTIADVMTSNVVRVRPDTTFKELAALLLEKRISAVPVVDDAGRPIGVVSESDLIHKEQFGARRRATWLDRRMRNGRHKATARTAGQVMTSPTITIEPTASLPEAARSLAQNNITRLIVVDPDGTLAGIVTRSDLLRVFLVSDRELQDNVRSAVLDYALWDDPWAIKVKARDGLVTLIGEVERRSLVPIAEELTRSVDGVVDVVNELGYVTDDTVPVRRPGQLPLAP